MWRSQKSREQFITLKRFDHVVAGRMYEVLEEFSVPAQYLLRGGGTGRPGFHNGDLVHAQNIFFLFFKLLQSLSDEPGTVVQPGSQLSSTKNTSL